MVIIEIGSGRIANPRASINKIVTIYPKDDIDRILAKTNPKDILYQK